MFGQVVLAGGPTSRGQPQGRPPRIEVGEAAGALKLTLIERLVGVNGVVGLEN